MQTKVVKIDSANIDDAAMKEACDLIRAGELVAFPTETVYGLGGGGGIAFLIRRFELNFRVRYSFGYSDIVRNRNKYYDNNSDGAENPFWATPLRSPLDNLMISVGLNYRFNKQGFEAWKPRPKKEKNREVFKFGL